MARSNPDPLDLVQGNLIPAAVVKAGGAGGFVVGHLLGDLELPAVLQICRDTGSTEGVAGDFGTDAGVLGPAANPRLPVRAAYRYDGYAAVR